MLVYGDPQFENSLRSILKDLGRRARACDWKNIDALRALLIQTGQLEQAVADNWESRGVPVPGQMQVLTNIIAGAFLQVWNGTTPVGRSKYCNILEVLQRLEDVNLTVKTPEGFEFYALYPEQYLTTAARWASEVAPAGQVLVVGIRSIGTSLSAVVMQTLVGMGLTARRFTVRLEGHPYERKVRLDAPQVNGAEWALIVDEGPGASGSSMTGTAQAFIAAGIRPDRVAFFPGHDGEPGSFARETVRRCWAETPRYFTPLQDITWFSKSLKETLTSHPKVQGKGAAALHDLGAGEWRKLVFARQSQWPAVVGFFERAKYLCKPRNSPAVFWKFVGLGSWVGPGRTGVEEIVNRANLRTERAWSVAVLGVCRGFLGMPWIDGKRLSAAEASPELLRSIAQYLAQTAGPVLGSLEQNNSLTRLDEMLRCNWKEVYGSAVPLPGMEFILASLKALPSYTDGRMAPYEWTKAGNGKLLKIDCGGHTIDHTCIGTQSILWDAAGVIVEWNLEKHSRALFLEELKKAGISACARVLTYFQRAYIAFRLGLMAQCPRGANDEAARLQQAYDYYYKVGETLAETPEP